MKLISYAQNFEDVILWRALGHVQNGFYIDIGAQHPVNDSVSKAFYEEGWRGVHVEATPAYAALLRQDRPDEHVIEAAVNDTHGVIEFFEIPSTGISTGDKTVAHAHQERGFDVRHIAVACVTLADIFQTTKLQDIHWLKIDVESMELQVLRSWGDNPSRPWVVVVESTVPLTQTDNHKSWEHCLLERGYTPVYFDGLNRFYLAQGHENLLDAFASGPNVFDDFTLHGGASAPFCVGINEQHSNAQQILQKQISINQHEIQNLQELKAAQETKHQNLEREWKLRIQTLQEQRLEAERTHAHAENSLRQLASESHQQGQKHLHTLLQREQDHTAQLHKLQAELQAAHQSAHQHKLALQIQTAEAMKDAQASAFKNLKAINEQEKVFTQELLSLHNEKYEFLNKSMLRERELQAETALSLKSAEAQARNREIVLKSKASFELKQAMREVQSRNDARLKSQKAQERALTAEIEKLRKSLAHASKETQNHLETLVLREREHAKELHEQQDQQNQQQLEWTSRQKDLDHEISLLKTAVQSLQTEATSLVQKHSFENTNKEATHQKVIQDYTTWQEQLNAELVSEQIKTEQLSKALGQVKAVLAATQTTWSWRATTPFRSLVYLFYGKNNKTDYLFDCYPKQIIKSEDCHEKMKFNSVSKKNILENPLINKSVESTNMPINEKNFIATSLNDLLSKYDEEFINFAYNTLLGRMPDIDGKNYYLDRVRQGYSKLNLLMQIRLSKECNELPVKLFELEEYIKIRKYKKIPIVGRFVNISVYDEADDISSRRLRIAENNIYTIRLENSINTARLESDVSKIISESNLIFDSLGQEITKLNNYISERLVDIDVSRNHKIEKENIDNSSESIELTNLPLQARQIYMQLKKSILVQMKRK